MKQFYSDHVTHAMKMYQRRPNDPTKATREDIAACASVLDNMTTNDANLIIDVYKDGDFPGAVKLAAYAHGVHESSVWALVDEFGRNFARVRGLL
ncbi:MAG: hypothetical protein IJF49_08420 [Clostridia bacterium]|nr:hypothetical protein [Clostridia bacterium]